jgi:hypothetical protein
MTEWGRVFVDWLVLRSLSDRGQDALTRELCKVSKVREFVWTLWSAPASDIRGVPK